MPPRRALHQRTRARTRRTLKPRPSRRMPPHATPCMPPRTLLARAVVLAVQEQPVPPVRGRFARNRHGVVGRIHVRHLAARAAGARARDVDRGAAQQRCRRGRERKQQLHGGARGRPGRGLRPGAPRSLACGCGPRQRRRAAWAARRRASPRAAALRGPPVRHGRCWIEGRRRYGPMCQARPRGSRLRGTGLLCDRCQRSVGQARGVSVLCGVQSVPAIHPAGWMGGRRAGGRRRRPRLPPRRQLGGLGAAGPADRGPQTPHPHPSPAGRAEPHAEFYTQVKARGPSAARTPAALAPGWGPSAWAGRGAWGGRVGPPAGAAPPASSA
jgi:hypothetical protein